MHMSLYYNNLKQIAPIMTNVQTKRFKKLAPLAGIVMLLLAALVFSGVLSPRPQSSRMAAAALLPVKEASMPVKDATAGEPTTVPLGSGEASYYGPGLEGRPTASGETFDPTELTAAHRTLPFGTRLRVTNTENGRSVIVRVNDRGPYAKDRLIDLSEAAAGRIGMLDDGAVHVEIERMG